MSAALLRFTNDPPAEGQQGPFPTESGCARAAAACGVRAARWRRRERADVLACASLRQRAARGERGGRILVPGVVGCLPRQKQRPPAERHRLCAPLRPRRALALRFHELTCSPPHRAVKIPTSFGTTLNLPKLYREVCSRGGYDNVRQPLPAAPASALGRRFMPPRAPIMLAALAHTRAPPPDSRTRLRWLRRR